MIKYFNKPHEIAFALTVLLIILTFVIYVIFGNSAIDLQMHDTYFVIAYYQLMVIPIIFYALIGFVYWLFRNRNLNIWLTRFHLLLSLFPMLVIIFLFSIKSISRRYYSFIGMDYGYNLIRISNIAIVVAIITLSLAQILLLINIIRSYLKATNIEK